MSSDVPSSTRPDSETGPSTPEHDPSEARAGLYDAEAEEERSTGEAVASEAEPSEAEAEAEAVAATSDPSEQPRAPEAVAATSDPSEQPRAPEAVAATSDSSEQPRAPEAVAATSDSSDDPPEVEDPAYEASSSDDPSEADGLAYDASSSDDPSEADGLAYDASSSEADEDTAYEAEPSEDPSEAGEAFSDADSNDDAYEDDADLLDVDLPQRRRRPLSGEEAAAALFHAKAILQAAAEAEAELPETDDTTEAEPSEPAPDDEADYLRSRLRALSDAAAAVEADAALFDTEADPAGAALFGAEAEPEAETLLYEAESALFRAEVALAEHEAELVAEAWDARTRAVCRYSGFAVGAALLDVHGQRFTGANVENASYNLGLCAERVALYHALTHGAGRFVAVAIVTEAPMPTSPCGACRQALWEFAPHAEILLVTRNGHQRMTMRDLLPHAFDHETLRAAGTAADDPTR